MPFYPYNPTIGQEIQTDLPGNCIDLAFVAHVNWVNPAAASDTAVHAAIACAAGATTLVTTAITNPDFPRALRIKGNQATVTGNVVITGTNMAGEEITETIASNGANSVDGNKAFKTVTQIVIPAQGSAGDTISVGYCDKLGLPYKLAVNTVLAAALNNVREGTAPTVAVSISAIEGNTVDINSALNGNQIDVWLLV